MNAIDFASIFELMQERERILNEGTLDEVIELAKEYHINAVQEHTTTPYKVMVDRIKQKLTKEHYDWTTL
jgi:hypothetical protein